MFRTLKQIPLSFFHECLKTSLLQDIKEFQVIDDDSCII